MSGYHIGRNGQIVPDSTAANRYAGRTSHWIKANAQERIPHRWIVADTESERLPLADGEQLAFRLACAVRWRDDLATGPHEERGHWWKPEEFWEWVTEYTWSHGRTVLWFYNSSHDVGQLDAFRILPAMGYELRWCNLDRGVSVINWEGPRGTLVIADAATWCPGGLDGLAGHVGMAKTPLPGRGDPDDVWLDRCRADTEITRRIVMVLLDYVRDQHLGNWQPSGAGMGHTAWRHRFMSHKVLVHDDADALTAEREAMHAGRAEAWWHGPAAGGPFTEWDMTMAYTQIAADSDLPCKLWDHDISPTRKVHEFGMEHFRCLARVQVSTDLPLVPCRADGRTIWPVGVFDTTLWDTELTLLAAHGGKYQVYEQWRYTRKPVLKAWADWSIAQCGLSGDQVHPVARAWVKHQARATIGRLGLRTSTWDEWGVNWSAHTGISLMTDAVTGQATRLMHVGSRVLAETERTEAQHAVPQIPSWIMSQCRRLMWDACLAAGLENVLHVDTDSIITNRAGTKRMEAAVAAGLTGRWRAKHTWTRLTVTGPRHYAAPGRVQVPGVPKRAKEQPDGRWQGEIWDSLARSLTEAPGEAGRIRYRTWTPRQIDHRRPWTCDEPGPAIPIRLEKTDKEGNYRARNPSQW